MINSTSSLQTAATRLAGHMDMKIVKDGRKLRLSPPDYMLDDYKKSGLGHDPDMIGNPDLILGHLILSLHGQPYEISYKKIWLLCKFDNLIDVEKSGWFQVEIMKMIRAGRGY